MNQGQAADIRMRLVNFNDSEVRHVRKIATADSRTVKHSPALISQSAPSSALVFVKAILFLETGRRSTMRERIYCYGGSRRNKFNGPIILRISPGSNPLRGVVVDNLSIAPKTRFSQQIRTSENGTQTSSLSPGFTHMDEVNRYL